MVGIGTFTTGGFGGEPAAGLLGETGGGGLETGTPGARASGSGVTSAGRGAAGETGATELDAGGVIGTTGVTAAAGALEGAPEAPAGGPKENMFWQLGQRNSVPGTGACRTSVIPAQ